MCLRMAFCFPFLMKKIFGLLVLSLSLGFASCDDDDDNGSSSTTSTTIGSTIDGSSSFVFEGYESVSEGFNVFSTDSSEITKTVYISNKQFKGDAYVFVLANESSLSDMTTVPDASAGTSTADIKEGGCYWLLLDFSNVYAVIKMRVAYISGNKVGVEYVVSEFNVYTDNANANSQSEIAKRLEMPRLNDANTFVTHYYTASGAKDVNYSLEWNANMKHAQWVAYTFDKVSAQKNTIRSGEDTWAVDPELPTAMQTTNYYFSNDGLDRGHLCPSGDRLYSEAANAQTFYFSNMSPQLNGFNAGLWQSLESELRSWGSTVTTGKFDTVYVAKGGTLNNLLKNFTGEKAGMDKQIPTTDANGYTVKGLPCPAYYYMAILAVKDGEYQAIGFLAPHKEIVSAAGTYSDHTVSEMQQYVVSIDELEEFTGEDFFCNLVDHTEDKVEAEYDLEAWPW